MQTARIKEIVGYPFHFACENGFIYRCQCIIDGVRYKSRIFNFAPTGEYYLGVVLRNNDGAKHFRAHRIIAECFIQNPLNKLFINHKNKIRNDNRVVNLEWVTASENAIHFHNYDKEKTNQFSVGEFVKIIRKNIVGQIRFIEGRHIIIEPSNPLIPYEYCSWDELKKIS